MISKYGIFCQVKEVGNFTKVAEMYGYSQSAVSQAVKALEQEIGFTLLVRQKGDVHLSSDGQRFWPYIQAIYTAEKALEQKKTGNERTAEQHYPPRHLYQRQP